jgi:hypothetical protein
MKILVIAIAALTIGGCARGQDSYGYIPPAPLNPGLDQCFTVQGETKRCDQAPPDQSALAQRKQTKTRSVSKMPVN